MEPVTTHVPRWSLQCPPIFLSICRSGPLEVPRPFCGATWMFAWIALTDVFTMTTATSRSGLAVTRNSTLDNLALCQLFTPHPRVISRRVADLVLRQGDRKDKEFGFLPVDGSLSESILVSAWHSGQVICLHLEPLAHGRCDVCSCWSTS
jgi:hypothetical protein